MCCVRLAVEYSRSGQKEGVGVTQHSGGPGTGPPGAVPVHGSVVNESEAPAEVQPGGDDRASAGPERGVVAGALAWAARHNRGLTTTAAAVPPLLYLLFVDRYAADSFNGDDWSVVLFVHAALHGHLTLGQLWGQYNESRLFVGNLVDVLFGYVDRLDLRSIIVFDAVVFVASYAILLGLLRRYLGRRLTPVPVLLVGGVWFSVADVQNSLWAFQVSWYLTVFFFLVLLFALLVPDGRRSLWFALAVLAAIAASLTTVQGFLCWPLGVICILWGDPRTRRAFVELALWCTTALITVAVYLPGYDVDDNGCLPASGCTPAVALHHPVRALGFFFALIGAVIPGGVLDRDPPRDILRFVVVGVVLFAAAVVIVIESVRFRRTAERLPLPLLLIGFSLAFDVTVALGRSGSGASGAASSNRYVMANLILVTAIVIYAWARVPTRGGVAPAGGRRPSVPWVVIIVLSVFLGLQFTQSVDFGLTNGSVQHGLRVDSARLFVNLDRVPPQDLPCELYVTLYLQAGAAPSFDRKLHDAVVDRLGQFEPGTFRIYRHEGLPVLAQGCRKAAAPHGGST